MGSTEAQKWRRLPRILRPGQTCGWLGRARAAGVLADGRNYYRTFVAAARQAQRYVLLAGWNFDRDVALLRGEDATGDGATTLLGLLDELCRARPQLRVFILAWDFSVWYALKRELFQSWRFHGAGHERIAFRFDSNHPLGASQHQKFVVIDGALAFVGGMDLCAGTWDSREHRAADPLRVQADGSPYPPRHDVAVWVNGRVARRLARLFARRWRLADGGRLSLGRGRRFGWSPGAGLRLPAGRVAISRTQGRTLVPWQAPVGELRRLYVMAIRTAERLIYFEHQYFASRAVYTALRRRLRAADRPRLQVVLVLPRQTEALVEELGLGAVQARYLRGLAETAARHGHALGVYNTRAAGAAPSEVLTFIHSKLMIVDDRFLTVGSANLSNRSLGFDSELNLAWEAVSARQRGLCEAIRALRVDLLAEHAGLQTVAARERLADPAGLVAKLDELVSGADARLCDHQLGDVRLSEWMAKLTPRELLIDPEKAVLAERASNLLGAGRRRWWRWLRSFRGWPRR